MKTYNEIMEKTERKTRIDNECISKQIIIELERIYHIHFPVVENNLTYGMLVQTLLFDPSYIEYRLKLLDLLEKYNVNEKNIVARFLAIVNQEGLLYPVKRIVEESFIQLPYCKRLEKGDNGYIIETKQGVLEVCQLSKLADNAMFYSLLKQNIFQGNCHQAVKVCSNLVSNALVVTSELESLFGGIYYHSYFKRKEEVMDIAANTLYKASTFNSFYEPKEILKVPADKLENYLEKLPKEEEKRCKVLRLAIENKIKMEEES